ncbi:MAG TPA: hypothetical protein VEK36_00510, partial [Candidatus Paceibacterota bacterium]|nr:hypothetical protein [Candidatus Paceibacterota bacterium]
PAPKLGIIEDGIDNPFSSLVFRQVERAWRGYVDGNLFTVTTGSVYSNPSQGVIVVLDDIFSDPKQYLSPTAAGPLQIVAEKQGVLTLKSIPGEFEVYLEKTDKREKVKTSGNTLYYFDLRTRTFK